MATTKKSKRKTKKQALGVESAVSPSPRSRTSSAPLVAVLMGSRSDWETMKLADKILRQFGVGHECRVISAHRTPRLAAEFAASAEARGLKVIIAAAGGAAHLAGVMAAHTTLPVLGVPIKSDALNGLDSLLSTVQMPAGIPVGTLAIGSAGALNAALFSVAILATDRAELRDKLHRFRKDQDERVRATKLD